MSESKFNPSREMCRNIKRMTTDELGKFLGRVFDEGYKSAVNHTDSISFEDLHNAISTVKGIGDKRMIEIDDAIRKLFQERGV